MNFGLPHARYFCTWGLGYEPHEQVHEQSFFQLDNGYTLEDLIDLKSLQVGETWTAPTNEVHTVRRIT